MFQPGSNVVNHTDGAQVYKAPRRGIVQHHSVNHSAVPRENSRAIDDLLLNVDTGEVGRGITSTNFIDSEWGRLEDMIPRAISARTEAQRVIMREYIRAAQWCRMNSTGNRWERWCLAAREWI